MSHFFKNEEITRIIYYRLKAIILVMVDDLLPPGRSAG
jgi:hypothetical protein